MAQETEPETIEMVMQLDQLFVEGNYKKDKSELIDENGRPTLEDGDDLIFADLYLKMLAQGYPRYAEHGACLIR
jgi:hypothetical protein